ncbi:bifunctional diaminohydroxyphosphoribosylaminopyrimidine deaminase/5-amino-6-(5-phosphoribosylamino)uracil reductase RibD [Vibrio quintilis]|uniref:Riboflavin biosynthesis protein RibD n=1 Tax=Vibrio quintilis TaxID=1117707 RepID=A0A1M7Z0M6_9VIBR|nr:bifunctional diaminohydroxyphosphoribosylaminopyrimidine deaminase/5-amino-6-(5-phosphoribosylamino)uracil reductase RibD [Vibrio quintilis]SHO58487.1 Riboflavin biosynthesis protein RibD [Vibrio quintilis]
MSLYTQFDYQMMSRAIALAGKGIYTTAPNPNVGCVIARDGQIVGEGFHLRAGEAHAEVNALRMAGDKAKNATAYVTLEPCSHYGRTPPCAAGLIQAGVKKVICAMQDPNPEVSGRGIRMLREAGIEVYSGLLEQDAASLNPAFIKRMTTGLPWVQLKMAASLDGQTALANGQSQWVTSPQARSDVQRYRAMAGAILSTSQTVITDNASLNVRAGELPGSVQYLSSSVRQPLRVILDRHHRLHSELKLYQAGGPVLTVGHSDSDLNVSLMDSGLLNLTQVMEDLASQHQVNHVWVEAGASLAGSLLKSRLVDELILYIAPKIMGSDGQGLFGHMGFERMEDILELDIKAVSVVGPDIRVTAVPKYKG